MESSTQQQETVDLESLNTDVKVISEVLNGRVKRKSVMKDRNWGGRVMFGGFISSYLYWLQLIQTLKAEIFTSVGQKEKK